MLIIGLTDDVEATLELAKLGSTPESLIGRGTARVWAERGKGGRPLIVVAADDETALAALLDPLPHYGRKSYLVFQGRRAIDTGEWPVTESPLVRTLAE